MVIHTRDRNIQTQARGRYRNDLKKLYLHSANSVDYISLPSEYLDIPLYKKDKDRLCAYLNLKDDNGRLLKWTSIKSRLKKCGYIIDDKRTKKERYTIIYEI